MIIENKIGIGVHIVTADDFFKTVLEITGIERFVGSNYERKLAVQTALQKVGLPYHLINYNCQHFANEIQKNRTESEQIDNFFHGVKMVSGILLFAALINAISGN